MASTLPIEKERAEIYKKMTPATKEVADKFLEKLGGGARGIALTYYDMGTRIADVLSNEAEYGSNAVAQLADYLNINGGTTALYALKQFATSFEREFVKDTSEQPLANGKFLELGHWIALSRVNEPKDVDKYVKLIRTKALSVNEFERELRASATKTRNARQGGRKPSVPTSPLAGLQKMYELSNRFTNFAPEFEKQILDVIEDLPTEKVTEALLTKLEESKERLTNMTEAATSAVEHIDKNIEQVKAKLAEKAETEAEEESDEPSAEDAKPKKKKKKDKAKGSKGKSGKGDKPKKKSKRPEAAVAS